MAGVPYRDLRGVPSLPRDDPVPHLAQAIRRTLLAEYGEGGARDGAAPPAVRDNSPDLPHDFESPVSSASRTHVAGQLQASLRAHLTRVHGSAAPDPHRALRIPLPADPSARSMASRQSGDDGPQVQEPWRVPGRTPFDISPAYASSDA